ncbi:tyrosine-type DNA invertase [Edaphovirga cremea]|uniref:tyrosine-type DNA invertase n=1 Tax=Edaphovirga cremea TaxID=2267246 RepID=UPI000DEF54BB|nr:tyrosine-type DNA invertase [Edaphovirga cremea]
MKQRKHLMQNEVKIILDAALKSVNPERDYCLIYMSFLHGCRVSEISQMQISDINIAGSCLYLRRLKNGLSTMHPMIKSEIVALQRWLKIRASFKGAETDWLFLSKKGNHLSRQRIYALLRYYGELAGLTVKAHPHMLRHACGYALADKGVDTRLIQDYLGHRNIAHTVRYTASNSYRFRTIWQSGEVVFDES